MHRRGIAMIEALLATAIVGGLLVAALSLVSSVAVEQRVVSERSTGQMLAQQLADEIAALPTTVELASASATASGSGSGSSFLGNLIGGFSGSSAAAESEPTGAEPGDRSIFNDIVDYDGHVGSPPTNRDGLAIEGANGWTRRVSVTEVSATDPEGSEVADTGVYRISVTAEFNGRESGTIVFYRSQAGDEASQ